MNNPFDRRTYAKLRQDLVHLQTEVMTDAEQMSGLKHIASFVGQYMPHIASIQSSDALLQELNKLFEGSESFSFEMTASEAQSMINDIAHVPFLPETEQELVLSRVASYLDNYASNHYKTAVERSIKEMAGKTFKQRKVKPKEEPQPVQTVEPPKPQQESLFAPQVEEKREDFLQKVEEAAPVDPKVVSEIIEKGEDLGIPAPEVSEAIQKGKTKKLTEPKPKKQPKSAPVEENKPSEAPKAVEQSKPSEATQDEKLKFVKALITQDKANISESFVEARMKQLGISKEELAQLVSSLKQGESKSEDKKEQPPLSPENSPQPQVKTEEKAKAEEPPSTGTENLLEEIKNHIDSNTNVTEMSQVRAFLYNKNRYLPDEKQKLALKLLRDNAEKVEQMLQKNRAEQSKPEDSPVKPEDSPVKPEALSIDEAISKAKESIKSNPDLSSFEQVDDYAFSLAGDLDSKSTRELTKKLLSEKEEIENLIAQRDKPADDNDEEYTVKELYNSLYKGDWDKLAKITERLDNDGDVIVFKGGKTDREPEKTRVSRLLETIRDSIEKSNDPAEHAFRLCKNPELYKVVGPSSFITRVKFGLSDSRKLIEFLPKAEALAEKNGLFKSKKNLEKVLKYLYSSYISNSNIPRAEKFIISTKQYGGICFRTFINIAKEVAPSKRWDIIADTSTPTEDFDIE